jgi:cytochrome c-type biogenesis protein CcmH/NrfG
MGINNGSTQKNTGWTSVQAYVLALICLLVGVAGGYFLRGSSSNTAAIAPEQTAAMGVTPGGTGAMGGTQPTPEQMKHMAEKQAEPLLAQLKADPNNAALLAQVGNVYYDTQSFKDAIDYYQRALKVKPDDPNVRTDLGTAYYYLGEPDKAIEEFNSALKYDPKHAQTYFNIGMVKWQGKADANGAVAAWEQLLKIAPDYPEKDKVQNYIAQAKKHANIKPGTKTDKPTM